MSSSDRNPEASRLGRISAVLDCFAAGPSTLTFADLTARIGLPKSSTSRLLAELVEYGFLERTPDGFRLGLRLFELGEAALRPRMLRRLAYGYMVELRRRTGHTVHLAVLDGAEVVYIEIVRARDAAAMPSRVGGRVFAHATAVGKMLLSQAGVAQREAVFARGLPAVGPETITNRDRLVAELDDIRRIGVALERSESAPGVTCVAMLLPVGDGARTAAMSVSGEEHRFDVNAVRRALADTLADMRRQHDRLPRDLRRL